MPCADCHAFNVFRRSFKADENDFFALLRPFLRIFGGENDLAAGSARGSRKAVADCLGFLNCFGVKLRVQQSVKLLRVNAENCFFFVDHAFVHEVAGNFQSGGSGTLAVAGLQHIQVCRFQW